jgi:hypothetical protein
VSHGEFQAHNEFEQIEQQIRKKKEHIKKVKEA